MRILAAALLTLTCTGSLAHEVIGVFAPKEVPYQYLNEQNQPDGLSVKVVQMVLKEAGVASPIEIMSTQRIQKTKMKLPNCLIFTVFRNPGTEARYKWVGSMMPFRVNLYRLKSRPDIQVDALDSLNQYSIGVVAGGARFRYLNENMLAGRLELAATDEHNLRKFFVGRFDLLADDPTMFRHAATYFGLDVNRAEKVLELKALSGHGYLAFTLGTSDAVVERFAIALEKVKAGEPYKQLLHSYGM